MTKLVGFSDTHGQVVTKDKLPDGDVLCFAGDYSYIRKNAPYETRMKDTNNSALSRSFRAEPADSSSTADSNHFFASGQCP